MAGEEEQCVFCHIASGKIPAKKVYEDDKVTAVLDINPATDGHILVIPKQHAAIMAQLDDELVAHLGMVAKQLSHALLRALKTEGTSTFVANGPAAGQRAPHFMLHLIPRKGNDQVALQPPQVKATEQQMKAVYDKLAPAIAKAFGKEPPKQEPKQKDEKKEEKSEQKMDDKQFPDKPPAPKPQAKISALDEIAEFLTGGKK